MSKLFTARGWKRNLPVLAVALVFLASFGWIGSSQSVARTRNPTVSSHSIAYQSTAATSTPVPDYKATIEIMQTQIANLATAVAEHESVDVKVSGTPSTVAASPSPTPVNAGPVPTSTVVLPDDYELFGGIGEGWIITTGIMEDKIDFKVLRIERTAAISPSYMKQPAGEWYVVVMELSVMDSAFSPFPFENFVLQDDQGRVFDPNIRASNSWSVEHGDMSLDFEDWWRESTFSDPLVVHVAGLVFDVPPTSGGFMLRSTDGVLAIELGK